MIAQIKYIQRRHLELYVNQHTSKQIIYPKNSYRIVQNGPTY